MDPGGAGRNADSGDTSGFSGLVRRPNALTSTPPPYGSYFDDLVAAIRDAYPAYDAAVQAVVVAADELTLHIAAAHIAPLCATLRDHPALRFEMLSSLSAVDYLGFGGSEAIGPENPRRFHVVYHLLSMTYRHRLRLEVAVGAPAPRVPSVVAVYPTADWQEREAYDLMGVVFVGHPGLTRIMMPDDWAGHPQRKDYPLGGVPVEFSGATVPPPDDRRGYR